MKHAAFCVLLFLCASAPANAQSEYGRVERKGMSNLFQLVEDERIARADMITAHRVIMKACRGVVTSIEKRNWVGENPYAAHREMVRELKTCKDYTTERGEIVTREQLEIVVRLAFNKLQLATDKAGSHPFSFQGR